jgi:hypothetical protein
MLICREAALGLVLAVQEVGKLTERRAQQKVADACKKGGLQLTFNQLKGWAGDLKDDPHIDTYAMQFRTLDGAPVMMVDLILERGVQVLRGMGGFESGS